MSTTNTNNIDPLVALSDAMAEAASTAGQATVMVDARRRLPASGILYASNLVITADHVVERDDDIGIVLPNNTRVAAQVAGRDPGSDLALLRLEVSDLTPAKVADQPARVGQLVMAIGRPSLEGIQASLGVVSAVGGPVRTRRGSLLEHYLRSDTIPYPGFSGGPLIDGAGHVLGINTSGLAQGISLTLPVSLAWKVAEALEQHGHVRRGYLGVRSQPVEIPAAARQALGRDQDTGLLLVGVEEDSPSSDGGLMVGDILVALGGEQITNADQLLSHLVGSIVGHSTEIEILRGGQPMTVAVRIGERK